MSVTGEQVAATTKPRKRSKREYDEEDIERGLLATALAHGNTAQAHRRLAEQGHNIPRPTLDYWATRKHVERYEKIRADVVPRIHAQIATESEDLAHAYAERERRALEHFDTILDQLEPRDVPNAIRNLATSRGISITQAAAGRGRPTQIIEHRDPADIARELAQMRPDVFEYVDDDAEEITDADVVDDEHPALTTGQASKSKTVKKTDKTNTSKTAR